MYRYTSKTDMGTTHYTTAYTLADDASDITSIIHTHMSRFKWINIQ